LQHPFGDVHHTPAEAYASYIADTHKSIEPPSDPEFRSGLGGCIGMTRVTAQWNRLALNQPQLRVCWLTYLSGSIQNQRFVARWHV